MAFGERQQYGSYGIIHNETTMRRHGRK